MSCRICGISAKVLAATPRSAITAGKSRSEPAKRMGERQQDQLGDGHSFDQQKRAICTKDAQRAFDLARPVERQEAGHRLDQAKVLVGSDRKRAAHLWSR